MRKQNSDFRTGFISEAGSQLKNNDYFGFVELDEYACYVIADGITQLPDADSARLAIETIVFYFQQNPSMSRRVLKNLITKANRALLGRDGGRRREASLTVILTDYRKFRFGYLGNTRLRLYRNGQVFRQTEDMSYSQELVDRERIPKDALQEHEERNNLYSYLGQKNAKPYVSGKIKLFDTDIITLYTRGIWENIDPAELDDVFLEAGNEAGDSLDQIEDLLLSRQPENLENYTFAAIFINKVYSDPKLAKKRKKIIIISVIVVLAIIIIIAICFFLYRRKQRRIADMNFYFTNTIEYINTNNYVRAKEECEKAKELANALKDASMRTRLQEYLFVIETVLLADESYSAGDYETAQGYYLTAMDRARYADLIGETYMGNKLDQIADHLTVMEDIELGDALLENAEYEKAEDYYLAAKKLAAGLHYTEGTDAAVSALERLYDEWARAEAEKEQQKSEQAQKEVSAAELTACGDRACLEQDFVGAGVYYRMALIAYQDLGDTVSEDYVRQKLTSVEEKLEELENKRKSAMNLESEGAQLQGSGDYWGAKSRYLQAKSLYLELESNADVERVSNILAQLDLLIEQQP